MISDSWYIFKLSLPQFGNTFFAVGVKCWLRYLWYGVILNKTKTLNKDLEGHYQVSQNTVFHNLKGLKLSSFRTFAGIRPIKLLQLASIPDHVDNMGPKKNGTAKLLTIGPRAESEIFLARTLGFKKANIRGLDLISYSPYIDLGDMHDMPYEDNTWDVIIMGWVLAYSNDPQKAISEVIRVAKDKAVITLGYQYYPIPPEEVAKNAGYMVGSSQKYVNVDAILELFNGHIEQVYFRHEPLENRRDKPGEIIISLAIKKAT